MKSPIQNSLLLKRPFSKPIYTKKPDLMIGLFYDYQITGHYSIPFTCL